MITLFNMIWDQVILCFKVHYFTIIITIIYYQSHGQCYKFTYLISDLQIVQNLKYFFFILHHHVSLFLFFFFQNPKALCLFPGLNETFKGISDFWTVCVCLYCACVYLLDVRGCWTLSQISLFCAEMERLTRETDPSARRFHNHPSRTRHCCDLHPNTDRGLGLQSALVFWYVHDPQSSSRCLSGISPVSQNVEEIPRSSHHYGETTCCALIPDFRHASPCLPLQYSSQ